MTVAMRRNPLQVLGLAVVALSWTASAATPTMAKEPAYAGKWATTAKACKLPPDTLNAPVVMHRRSYDQFETHCDFPSVAHFGGAWHTVANCSVDGDIQKDKLVIWATAKALTLHWNNSIRRLHFARCK